MRVLLLLRRPTCAERIALKVPPFRQPLSTGFIRQNALPGTPCRTRFAPSPTGYLHLGSLRTALYNYLLAKATNGQFVLRLEDTDQSRLVTDAEKRLYDDLKWAGLSWDEGPDVGGKFGPYRQSERLGLYDAHVDRLVREDKAYRCFCSPEDLEAHKRHSHEHGLPTAYPGTCLSISAAESEERCARGDPHAVRFKSYKTPTTVRDLVYKRYKKAEPEEDFIIRKRDGFPTYHFANVVDDHAMEITHVIRGAEWLISTPKHVQMYAAFGWQPPQFAHVGLLVNSERQKLSKRHPGVDMTWYRDGAVLPPALLNFAVLLGWYHGPGKDIMSLEEMVEKFSLKFTKGDIVVSMDKLPHFQRHHTQRVLAEDPPNLPLLAEHFVEPIRTIVRDIESTRLEESSIPNVNSGLLGELIPSMNPDDESSQGHILKALRVSRTPTSRLEEFVQDNRYLFWTVPQQVLDERLGDTVAQNITMESRAATLGESIKFLENEFKNVSGAWTADNLDILLKKAAKCITFYDTISGRSVNNGGYNFLRWALLGRDRGPALDDVMDLLGKEETIRRLELASKVANDRVRDGD